MVDLLEAEGDKLFFLGEAGGDTMRKTSARQRNTMSSSTATGRIIRKTMSKNILCIQKTSIKVSESACPGNASGKERHIL